MNEQERFRLWKARVTDQALSKELALMEGDQKKIHECFYGELVFGTAGLRGILGAGSDRMNLYTVRRATQGLADYLNRQGGGSAAIAFDSRNFSELFAREAAAVLAANGVGVHLFAQLAPTPLLSFAVRELGCAGGAVVTASHNPANYNGYKVYGADGCQMTAKAAGEVYELIQATDLFDGVQTMPFEEAVQKGLISYIGEELFESYYRAVKKCMFEPQAIREADLGVVYTPLNGAGKIPVKRLLKDAGVERLAVVPEQENPDGNFTTCPYPNPEAPEALTLAIKLFEEREAELLLATDPDSDRIAIGVRGAEGCRLVSGNELGVLLLDYIGKMRQKQGSMPARPIFIKSIVTSRMADAVGESYGIEPVNVLTGFKYIGEQMTRFSQAGEEGRFVFGFEESCGYLPGAYCRDKDGVATALLVTEMAARYKLEGKDIAKRLDELYEQHGVYLSQMLSTAFTGVDSMEQMTRVMEGLRRRLPREIAGSGVISVADYLKGIKTEAGRESELGFPSSDVLSFFLADGSTVIARPSGTEPKLKCYYMVKAKSREEAQNRYQELVTAMTELLKGNC